uniref:Uncharacterized protein n=1 Tax=Knipowitschia caucasica TaxID=637954 RepID=A0AAV2LGV3_KNICA
MLKAALILGCLLSLTLASPLKERQERRRLARSDSDSYERLSINPFQKTPESNAPTVMKSRNNNNLLNNNLLNNNLLNNNLLNQNSLNNNQLLQLLLPLLISQLQSNPTALATLLTLLSTRG